MRQKNYVTSYFRCQECDMEIPLPRCGGKQRKKGHVKDIWCPRCLKKTKCSETRYMDSYKTMAGEVISEK